MSNVSYNRWIEYNGERKIVAEWANDLKVTSRKLNYLLKRNSLGKCIYLISNDLTHRVYKPLSDEVRGSISAKLSIPVIYNGIKYPSLTNASGVLKIPITTLSRKIKLQHR